VRFPAAVHVVLLLPHGLTQDLKTSSDIKIIEDLLDLLLIWKTKLEEIFRGRGARDMEDDEPSCKSAIIS
jgi:hypothetical protein